MLLQNSIHTSIQNNYFITKQYSYKYMNNYTSICICIHVSIPGLLYENHWRHAK